MLKVSAKAFGSWKSEAGSRMRTCVSAMFQATTDLKKSLGTTFDKDGCHEQNVPPGSAQSGEVSSRRFENAVGGPAGDSRVAVLRFDPFSKTWSCFG